MKQGTYRINICVTKNHELKIHNNEIILSSFCVTPDRLLNCGEVTARVWQFEFVFLLGDGVRLCLVLFKKCEKLHLISCSFTVLSNRVSVGWSVHSASVLIWAARNYVQPFVQRISQRI